jgi:tRNA nucleotidyltransferase (CCA-adding enzyme)
MNLLDQIPHPQKRAIEIVREVALEKECRPWLVGGPVRDLLLGRPSIDLDLTLEQGGSTLARALAKRVQGRVRSFPQFLTYKVTADQLPEIDIATARKERYRQPGALPAVTEGTLKDDLERRDFTINAIAIDILDGRMEDPTGGRRDISRRLVRVLHGDSFTDDPTRIFRAIRLAARLGFKLGRKTETWMRAAIEGGAMATVSKERIWRELFLAMDEEEAPQVLEELAARGALDVLFGRRTSGELRARVEAYAAASPSDAAMDRHVLLTGALLRGDASPVDFEGSGFSQKRARAVVEIANDVPRLLESLRNDLDERQRFRIYKALSLETRLALGAERPDELPHLRRFEEFQTFQIPVRGTDLEVPGGPHVARAIERTREAVFNGEISADEARTYAKRVVKELMEEPA